MIGNKYGKLTVIELLEERTKSGHKRYLCKCDCGKETIVRHDRLKSGKTKSCGCLRGNCLVGNRYGKLIVIKEIEERKNRNKQYLCKCDCGNEIIATSTNLISENTKSCGCIRSSNIVGNKYGKLTVIKELEERKNRNKQYLCKCDCGNEMIVKSTYLRSGRTKSCGCIKRRRK